MREFVGVCISAQGGGERDQCDGKSCKREERRGAWEGIERDRKRKVGNRQSLPPILEKGADQQHPSYADRERGDGKRGGGRQNWGKRPNFFQYGGGKTKRPRSRGEKRLKAYKRGQPLVKKPCGENPRHKNTSHPSQGAKGRQPISWFLTGERTITTFQLWERLDHSQERKRAEKTVKI